MIHELSALELAQQIHAGNLTSQEVTQHFLARIDGMNEQVGAYLTVTAERALEQAKRADDALRIGEPESPLHGIPVPVKDLNLVAGVRTTFGSAAMDHTPTVNDAIVDHLAKAGTIMIGKTNTPEFGFPCYTEPDVGPPARTPWDPTRSAGGSSGGAGAAVAAGLAPVAQGSDGGGSIRIPASVCGLVGIKPSRGVVSNAPMGDSVGELGVNGPLARTVADAAALLDVLAGPFPSDLSRMSSRATSFLEATRQEPGRLRIARTRTPFISDVTVAQEVIDAYEQMSALLESLGHEVIDVELNVPDSLVPHFESVWSTSAASIPLNANQEQHLRPLTTWLRERGRGLSAVNLSQAVTMLRQTAHGLLQHWSNFDVLLTPTLASLPVGVGELRNDSDPAADFEAQKAFTPFTALVNMTGQPAMSVPVMWTAEGLPVGMQLVGRPHHEALLISLAIQLEQTAPWWHRYHELWGT